MVYCAKCGIQLTNEAYFCPRCGIKTEAGKTAQAVYPTDELRAAIYQVGIELEKVLTFAAHETKAAFRSINEETLKNTSPNQQTEVTCTSCGAKNPFDAIFCGSCGKKTTETTNRNGL